jgi:class 3 adenylate cyclase/tetratricopeptide (TPR) repeat protein
MRCSKCEAENPDGAKFCGECASPFTRRCPSCDSENSPIAKFCIECAKPLESAGGKSQRTASASSPLLAGAGTPDTSLEGERKTVTTLFADIKGSMELIEDLDPEEARAIVDPALKLMIDAVHHYEGYVAQSTGDGIFALFGAPVAHEDHPQRALFAAMRMQAEVKRYSERLRAEKGVNLQVRVGANTGEVVVREIRTGEKHTEYAPIGHSTGVAARLEALAVPGSIVISESVRKLVEGYFALKALGPVRIKGVSEPLEIYEVEGLGTLRTRLQRSAARGYTKFVGRQREMETMNHAAELARTGHGQIVAAVAEAGVGKSRLLHEFKARNQSRWMVLEAISTSHGKASPYVPVLDLLHSYFGIDPGDEARRRREKVHGKVLTLDRALDDALPYLFGLLGLIEDDDPLAGMDAQIRRRRTHEALKRILLRESLNQPLMLFFEDMHWIDDETQAFVNVLADSIGTAKLLLLVSYRPEYSHQWNSKTYYTQLRLDPLGGEFAAELLDALLGVSTQTTDRPLAALKRLIIERTEGTPLFMEEIVQALQEDGAVRRNGTVKLTRPLDNLRIPSTVQDILASRIDRLPAAEKELLQTLAVIGMEFPLALVREVITKPNDELSRKLSDLQLAEFIYEQPAVGGIEYIFKHPLTQEVSYNSVLLERRKVLHERIGTAIEMLFPQSIDDHLSELARHYVKGNNIDKGREYSFRAGKQAALRGAHGAAESFFRVALSLVRAMPETPAKDRRELEILNDLGMSLSVLKSGFSAPEVRATYARAAELFIRIGGDPELHLALIGKWAVHLEANELREALATAELALVTALAFRHRHATAFGRVALGASFYYMGRFAEALSSLREASLTFESLEIKADTLGHQLAAVSGIFLGATQQALGFHDSGLKAVTEAGRSLMADASLELAYVFFYRSLVHHLRGESIRALECGETLIKLSSENALASAAAFGLIARGGALVQQGLPSEGIAQLSEGFQSVREVLQLTWPWCNFLLAEAYLKAGRYSEGLDSVAQGLARSNQKGERVHEALLWWVRGELLIKTLDGGGAESSLRMAIDMAREQSARAWELCATTSLARLLTKEGKRAEARAMLAEIYNWFTEGFDTADLKDAKALLDQLNE